MWWPPVAQRRGPLNAGAAGRRKWTGPTARCARYPGRAAPGAGGAGLAFPPIDREVFLEAPDLAIRADIVAQARPAGADALGPAPPDRGHQPLRPRPGMVWARAGGARCRANTPRRHRCCPGPHDLLVEQRGLDGRALALECRGQRRGGEAGLSGSGPRSARKRCASSAAVATRSRLPKRRGSTKPTRQPWRWRGPGGSCASGGALWRAASDARPCGPMRGAATSPARRATIRPDNPGDQQALPALHRNQHVLCPRRKENAPAPRSAREAGGRGKRRSGRRTSASTMRWPSSTAARPRITVSPPPATRHGPSPFPRAPRMLAAR